jgi:anti-anti-sigma regulatory factor
MTTRDAVLFSVHREDEPDCVRIRLAGELYYGSVDVLQAELDDGGDRRAAALVVDVSELCFLDLAGMRAVMSVFDRESWRSASLVGASGSVRRLIGLAATLRSSSGLDRRVEQDLGQGEPELVA